MTSGLRLVFYLNYGIDDAKEKMRVFLEDLGGEAPLPRSR